MKQSKTSPISNVEYMEHKFMIIQCGGCKTKYKIDDNKISSSGLKISCKKCNKIISVTRKAPTEKQGSNKTKDGTKNLDKIVSKTGDLPPMPHVAMKVLEMVQISDTGNEDLRKIISQDQALTAQILKFSNSAMYSCAREVKTLSDALVVLGYNTLKSLVITSSTQAVYKRKKKIGLVEKKLWEHSVATGIGAREIGKFVRITKSEEAFTGGLLHDIGKVILYQGISDEYNEIVQDVYNSGGSFLETERERLGFDHADVGHLVLEKWKFADTLKSAIQFHHDISKSSKESACLVAIINCADNIANKNCFGLEANGKDVDLASIPSAKYLGLSGESITEIEKIIMDIIETDTEMMKIN